MTDSDGEYVHDGSSGDDRDHHVDDFTDDIQRAPANSRAGPSSSSRKRDDGRMTIGRNRGRARERWEGSVRNRKTDSGALGDTRLSQDLNRVMEARKRARIRQDTQPFQRGIIRHLVLVLDLSEAMLEKDLQWRPNRFLVEIRETQEYIREFFEQNPISQLSVLAMYDGKCIKVSELSGNPTDHVSAIQRIRTGGEKDVPPMEPKGSPSLQNALELSRAMLYHTPTHGIREVLIVLGALLSNDPGDIHQTISTCVKDRIRVNIIGINARMKICQDIVSRTNEGDDSGYAVATDQFSFRELLMSATAPPIIRSGDYEANAANLLLMGFPSRMEEQHPSLCACHGNLARGGYTCPRCKSKVCTLPQTCPSCGLTLILSTHLARSYHHLFPLRSWLEVSWQRAREMGSQQCKGCLRSFPPVPDRVEEHHATEGSPGEKNRADPVSKPSDSALEGASESSRYECPSCHHHYCVDCDVFCHQTLFNCPGCQSGPPAQPLLQTNGGGALADVMDTTEG